MKANQKAFFALLCSIYCLFLAGLLPECAAKIPAVLIFAGASFVSILYTWHIVEEN
jgi:hypothetical protein